MIVREAAIDGWRRIIMGTSHLEKPQLLRAHLTGPTGLGRHRKKVERHLSRTKRRRDRIYSLRFRYPVSASPANFVLLSSLPLSPAPNSGELVRTAQFSFDWDSRPGGDLNPRPRYSDQPYRKEILPCRCCEYFVCWGMYI